MQFQLIAFGLLSVLSSLVAAGPASGSFAKRDLCEEGTQLLCCETVDLDLVGTGCETVTNIDDCLENLACCVGFEETEGTGCILPGGGF
ncbi:hypothetical protein CVT24_008577 [Panaeolus cyanescens]|uniref:Hydrophobin n=1 Tax=Panaeolus cyanescens TaxID=181874 RepID=A0A409VKS2_9AGAR|nr:hypothetical protein CVT24_008577 [Panaeolus cyanescens]